MTRFGDYDLEEIVGRGGTATVWRARRAGSTRRAVAIRIPAAGDLVRRREVEHPHLLPVLDVVEEDGTVGVVTPLASGSLAGRLQRNGTLSAAEVLRLGEALAGALAALHGHGLVHGDVTPANVLFGDDGAPLLGDLPTAGQGTPGYAAPEVMGGATPTPRSDVYGLAATCHRALRGTLPHPREDTATPADATMAAVLAAALQRDPSGRPADGAALERRLSTVRVSQERGGDPVEGDEPVTLRFVPVTEVGTTATTVVDRPASARREIWPTAVAAATGASGLLMLGWLALEGAP